MKELLFCPLCGGEEFDEFELNDSQSTAIYCKFCPYGVEDTTMTIEELRVWHNTRSNNVRN